MLRALGEGTAETKLAENRDTDATVALADAQRRATEAESALTE